jgi:hypothetical protein
LGPGFKYHVVTVASLFFALTIGLVVGSLLLSPQVVRSQSRLLSSLNARVGHDMKERDQELERYQRCLAAAAPQAVIGRLTGKHVAILIVGDYPEAVAGLREMLEAAGAQITGTLTIDREFARPDDLLVPKLEALRNDDARMPRDRQELAAQVATAVGHGDNTTNPILPALERAEFVKLDGDIGFQTGASAVVLVAGSRSEGSNRISEVDQPLVAACRKLGMSVVMCEPEQALVSDVAGYRALNIDVGTVDNIDSDIGRFALVFVLCGAKDDYGVKPTAKDLIPPTANSPTN